MFNVRRTFEIESMPSATISTHDISKHLSRASAFYSIHSGISPGWRSSAASDCCYKKRQFLDIFVMTKLIRQDKQLHGLHGMTRAESQQTGEATEFWRENRVFTVPRHLVYPGPNIPCSDLMTCITFHINKLRLLPARCLGCTSCPQRTGKQLYPRGCKRVFAPASAAKLHSGEEELWLAAMDASWAQQNEKCGQDPIKLRWLLSPIEINLLCRVCEKMSLWPFQNIRRVSAMAPVLYTITTLLPAGAHSCAVVPGFAAQTGQWVILTCW